ncbi:MAG TPA: 4Fe-4S binding protein, partial [Labilithrix sp.]
MNAPQRAKAAPRATATSDVTRPRTLLLASLGAAVGAGAILAAGASPLATDKPMARPHAIAKVACAKCHDAPDSATTDEDRQAFAAAGACKSCHAQHASMRPAHRALAARGELRCATCHPPHEGAQGVSFAAEGSWVRWGAGAETAPAPGALHAKTTVPIVSLAACAKCHDPTSARDPIAACTTAEVRADPSRALAKTPSLCFDEHKALLSPDPQTKAGPRFVAWEAARAVAVKTPWISAASASGAPWAPLGGAFAGATALGLVATALERRRRKPAQAAPVVPTAPSQKKKLPIVDTSTCLGCYACVDACPFDVLQIEKYVAVVARPEECCGVVLCEQVCPNGSLKIDEGEPVLDRARVDDHLESADVPGLYLAGDLTGLPLIKNAINQGVRVVDRIASTLPRRRKHAIDVLVVGAGPAGLSAALRA